MAIRIRSTIPYPPFENGHYLITGDYVQCVFFLTKNMVKNLKGMSIYNALDFELKKAQEKIQRKNPNACYLGEIATVYDDGSEKYECYGAEKGNFVFIDKVLEDKFFKEAALF